MPLDKQVMIAVVKKVRARHPHAVVEDWQLSKKKCPHCQGVLVIATFQNGKSAGLARLLPILGKQTELVCPYCRLP